MAKEQGGLRWYLKLLLDKASTKRVKKEAQDALDGGTDPAKPTKNLKTVESGFDRLKKAAVKLGAILGAMWVVRQVVAYGKAIFDLGAKVNATESQFRVVFGTISDGLEESLAGFRKIAGVTDTELRKLLAAAGSMGQGMGMSTQASADFASEVVKLAGDLASFSGGAYTTEAAAQLLQSALIGNTEAARALLVNFTALDVQNRAMEQTGKATADALTQEDKALAGLSVIMERAGPQLGDLARTQKDADNQAKILAATWRQMKEDISLALLPAFDALFRELDESGALERAAEAAKALAENMDDIFRAVSSAAKALKAVATLDVRTIFDMFLDSGGGDAAKSVDDFMASLDSMSLEQINEQIRLLGEQQETVQQQIADASTEAMKPALQRNLDAFRAAGLKAVQLRIQLQKELDEAGGEDGDTPPGTSAAEIAAAEARVKAMWAHLNEWRNAQKRPSKEPIVDRDEGLDLTLKDVPDFQMGPLRQLSAAEEAFKDLWYNVENASQHAAAEMASAFEDAFGLMREEGATIGNLFEGLGRGIAGSMLQGLAEYARGEAAKHVASAIGAGAEALSAAAFGNAPSAAAFWSSSAQHAAAAVAWSALAGGAGAARSAVTGGGGAVPTATRDAGLSTAERAERTAPEIHIYVDGIDPANPSHQRLTKAALDNAGERYGKNGKVTYHGR